MSRLFLLFLVLSVCFGSIGCTSAAQRKNKALATAIWSAKKNIEAGKINVAKKYLDEASRVVSKPKEIKDIKPLQTDDGKTELVILPKELVNKKVVVEETAEYKNLVAENKKLASQIIKDNTYIAEYSKEIDGTLKAIENEMERAKKQTFLASAFAIFSSLGLIGTIILCIFFPAAIPYVISAIQLFVSWVANIIKSIFNSIIKRDG